MASPVKPSDFESAIPNASSSLCGSFVDALLKVPVLITRFMDWMLDESGEFTPEYVKAISNASVKTGMIVPSACAISDLYWLLCNGQPVSRSTYANLFNAIGTVYGVGDNSTTFNVPDMRDRMPVGAGTTFAVGATGGSSELTLTEAMLPKHKHYFNVATGESGHTIESEVGRLGGTSVGWNLSDASTKAGLTRDIGPGTPAEQTTITLPRSPFCALYFYVRV